MHRCENAGCCFCPRFCPLILTPSWLPATAPAHLPYHPPAFPADRFPDRGASGRKLANRPPLLGRQQEEFPVPTEGDPFGITVSTGGQVYVAQADSAQAPSASSRPTTAGGYACWARGAAAARGC